MLRLIDDKGIDLMDIHCLIISDTINIGFFIFIPYCPY